MRFENTALRPGRILLPGTGVKAETWACVACDQYTSEPEYWEKAEQIVGEAPSALRLILPECWLKESGERIPRIHAAMREYLEKGLLRPAVKDGFVLCERQTEAGTRGGLVGLVDLEQYSFAKKDRPPVRPTEQTVAERLPARLAIRRGAPVELSHIMILIDDPEKTVIEPLREKKGQLEKLYDLELMLGGGHLNGWAVTEADDLEQVELAMGRLAEKAGPGGMVLAVGDGNHSLATAKAYWEEIREGLSAEERERHPARFALCEIVNLHDVALRFEPIHRLIIGAEKEELLKDWKEYAAKRGQEIVAPAESDEDGQGFILVDRDGEESVRVKNTGGDIPCQTVQGWLDDYLGRHPGTGIDYIHGVESLRKLAQGEKNSGILLPEIDKMSFFEDVQRLGVLPRKTFSMGEAHEKRYYVEAHKI